MRRKLSLAALLALALAPAAARGQSAAEEHRFEVGAMVTTLDMRDAVGEKPLGVGGRFAYRVNDYVDFDSELTRFPEDASGNFGQTQGLFGIKVGKRFAGAPFGVFVKLRPGFVNLGEAFARRSPGAGRTKLAADVGGVLEFYPSARTAVRVDAGQTFINFGDAPFNPAIGPPRRLGATANFQAGVGFGYRF